MINQVLKENHGEMQVIQVIFKLQEMHVEDSVPIEESPPKQPNNKSTTHAIYKYANKGEISLDQYIVHNDEYQWGSIQIDQLIENRMMHAVCTIGGIASYVFGGIYNGKFSKQLIRVTKQLECTIVTGIKPDTKSRNPLPTPKVLHTMESFSHVSDGNCLMIYGGIDAELNISNDLYIVYGLESQDLSPSCKHIVQDDVELPRRYGHSCSRYLRSIMMIFGGIDSNGVYLNDVMIMNMAMPTTFQVPSIRNQPPPRAGHAATIIDNSTFLIYGGHNKGEFLNDCWIWPHDASYWQKIVIFGPSPRLAFSSPVFVTMSKDLVLIGGFDGKKWSNRRYHFLIDNEMHLEIKVVFDHQVQDSGVSFCQYLANGSDFLRLGGVCLSELPTDMIKFLSKISGLDYTVGKSVNIFRFNMQSMTLILNEDRLHRKLEEDFTRWFQMQDPENSDVVFYFGDKVLYAHQFLLLNLDKLNTRFKESTKMTEIFMDSFKDVDYESFYSMLMFIYTGSIKLTKSLNVELLHKTAKYFNHKPLKEICSGELSFDTVADSYLSSALLKATSLFLIPRPIEEIIESVLPGNMIHMIAKESFDEDSNTYFISVHRSLLIIRSEYFKMMFDSNFSERTCSQLEITELTMNGLVTFIKYLYTGTVPEIKPEFSLELYLSIHKYQIPELQPYIRAVIRESVDPTFACAILEIAETISDSFMVNFCIHLIAKNFIEVKSSEEFTTLSFNNRQEIEFLYNKKYATYSKN